MAKPTPDDLPTPSGLPAFDAPRTWRKAKTLPKSAGDKAADRRKAIEAAVTKRNEGRCESEIKRGGKKRRCDFKKGHFGTTHKSVVTIDDHTSCVYWDSKTRDVWFEDYEETQLAGLD